MANLKVTGNIDAGSITSATIANLQDQVGQNAMSIAELKAMKTKYYYEISITHDQPTLLSTGSKTPIKLSDGSTIFNFKSSGKPLLITGGVYEESSSGGNVYFCFRIDDKDYGYYTTSKSGYFGLHHVVLDLSAGEHTFSLMGWINVGKYTVSPAARTNIILAEL